MSRRPKSPVTSKATGPDYPEASEAALDRRRFFALLGGSAAAFLVAGCKKEECERLPGQEPRMDVPRLGGVAPPRIDPPTDPGPRALPKVVVPGMVNVPNEPGAPAPVLPPGRTSRLPDRTVVVYRLYFSYDDPSGRAALASNADRIIREADFLLRSDFDYHSLSGQDAVGVLRESLRETFSKSIGVDQGFVFLDVEILRLRSGQRLRGKVRPASHGKRPLGGGDPLGGLDL